MSFYATPLIAAPSAEQKEAAIDIEALANADLQELLDIDIGVSSRLPTTLIDTPGSVTIFRHQDIERMGIRTLNELLNFVPGMMVVGGSNSLFTHLSVRGDTSFFGNNTLLLIDNIPVNNYMNASWMYENNSYSLANVERIEVMRGPSAALYGKSAISAVINLVTIKNQNTISLQTGSQNQFGSNGRWSLALEDIMMTTSFDYYQDKGYHFNHLQTIYTPLDTQDSTKDGVIDHSRDPVVRSNLSVALTSSNLEGGITHNASSYWNYYNRDGFINNPLKTRAEQTRWYLNYIPGFSTDEKTELKLQYQGHLDKQENSLGLHARRGEYGFYAFGPKGYFSPDANVLSRYPNGLPADALGYNKVESLTQQMNADFLWQKHPRYHFSLGAGIEYNRLYDDTTYFNYNLTTLDYVPQYYKVYGNGDIFNNQAKSEFNWNIHGEAKLTVNSDTILYLGGRYDKLEHYKLAFSPRLSIVHTLNQKNSIKLIYNEAVRRQNPSLLFNQVYTIDTSVLNTIQYQLIEIAHELTTNILYLQTSLYQRQTSGNALISASDFINGVTTRSIIKPSIDQTAYGLEFTAKLFLSPKLQATSGLSYIFNRHPNPKPSAAGVVQPTITASLGINSQWNQFNSNFNGYYIGNDTQRKIFSTAVNPVKPIVIFNWVNSYQATQKIKYSLAIYNLFNRITSSYNDIRINNDNDDAAFFPLRGRTYQLSLNYQF